MVLAGTPPPCSRNGYFETHSCLYFEIPNPNPNPSLLGHGVQQRTKNSVMKNKKKKKIEERKNCSAKTKKKKPYNEEKKIS